MKYSLSEISTLITKGTTPTLQDGGFSSAGVNYIKSESLSYCGQIDTSRFSFISKETHDKLIRSHVKESDILYSIAGANLGKCGLAKSFMLPANTNQAVAIIRIDPKKADPLFVSYVLRNRAFVESVLSGVAQSAQPNVNLSDIRQFKVPNLSISEQFSISSTLGALDDKIELNRQMNETLETMARAIFKDWFVDFGPTRAKMEGRAPYLAPDIWSLFSDRLDDEGKPERWDFGTLNDVSDLNSEVWSDRNHPDHVFYIDLSNTKWGVIEQVENYAWELAPSRARRVLRPGDTIVGTVRPGNGSFALIGDDNLTASTGFAVLRPRNPIYREFVWCASTSPENIERLSHLADGGAYPAVRPDVVSSTATVIPHITVIEAFSRICQNLINKISAARDESRSLSSTRDLLLPKLMSGEIRVKDAKKIIESIT